VKSNQAQGARSFLSNLPFVLSKPRNFFRTPTELPPDRLLEFALADIWSDIRRVAASCGVGERGEEAGRESSGPDARFQRGLSPRSPVRPRVACIEWHEPLMAAGNWVPELVEMAGAVNLFGQAGAHSPWMTWPELAGSRPGCHREHALRLRPGPHQRGNVLADSRPEWPKLRAVETGQVYLADGNQYFNRPGPRIVESLAESWPRSCTQRRSSQRSRARHGGGM
jgi:iron complex transport system substrate-binding protein